MREMGERVSVPFQIPSAGSWPKGPIQRSVREELSCGDTGHRSRDLLRRSRTTETVKSSIMKGETTIACT
jgi:hypothetical protein